MSASLNAYQKATKTLMGCEKKHRFKMADLAIALMLVCYPLVACQDSTPKSAQQTPEVIKTEKQNTANAPPAKESGDKKVQPIAKFLPPELSGRRVLTPAELKARTEATQQMDMSDVVMQSPGNIGEPGLALAELKARAEAVQNIDMSGVMMPRPGNGGEPGPMLTELKARAEAVQQMDMSGVMMPRPGNGGEPGLTLTELKTRAEAARKSFSNIDGMILPSTGKMP